MYTDDDDIFRGLGFVVMHAAHLEGRIDSLLDYLIIAQLASEKDFKLPISAKIKKVLSSFNDIWITDLLVDLESCLEHFEWRNELIHGRIYSPNYSYNNLESGRRTVPNRRAESSELYELANRLRDLDALVYRPQILNLGSFVKKVLGDL